MKQLIITFLLSPLISLAVVDTQSAGYSKTFVDFRHEGVGFPLLVERTYNSRSLYNGLFGFGWCSNLETRLTALPDNSVKSVECGGGLEVFYYPKAESGNVDLQVRLILRGVQRKAKLSPKKRKQLEKDLRQSQTLRADFMSALNIQGKIKQGVKYYANGRASEYVILRAGRLTRYLPNGITEIFNKDGRMVRSFDRAGNRIDITWAAREVLIKDTRGRRLQLVLRSSGKVRQIKFNGKVVASYRHDGNEDLRWARNAFNEEFSHDYDKFHNLTKNTYPDKTTEVLTYKTNKDWVTSFKDRKGCLESYTFGKNPKNSDHYFSTVQKTCRRKVVNNSKYEFWNRPLPSGKGKYLHRARSRVNGRLTDVIFHPRFGTPVSLLKNGVRTARKYHEAGRFIGLLMEKRTAFRTVKYENYSAKCRKPENVRVILRDSSGKKVLRTDNTSFEFRPNCQLLMARKSKEEWIKVSQDDKGRIDVMEDQSRKVVKLRWHNKYNKPEIITRPGIGSIRLVFNSRGAVVDVKGKSGPTVMSQVASVFNSFLETLSPVAEEMVIL